MSWLSRLRKERSSISPDLKVQIAEYKKQLNEMQKTASAGSYQEYLSLAIRQAIIALEEGNYVLVQLLFLGIKGKSGLLQEEMEFLVERIRICMQRGML